MCFNFWIIFFVIIYQKKKKKKKTVIGCNTVKKKNETKGVVVFCVAQLIARQNLCLNRFDFLF